MRTGTAALFLLATWFLSTLASTSATAKEPLDMAPFHEELARDATGTRNTVYKKYFDAIEGSGLRRPEKDWARDPYMLLLNQRTLVGRARLSAEKGPILPSGLGFELPAGMFAAYREQLKNVFQKRLNLKGATALSIATVVERQAVELAKLSWKDYLAALDRVDESKESREGHLREAMAIIEDIATLDARFDIPFIAGYDKDDGHYIFVDREVPKEKRVNGRLIPVHFLLTVHELVEKSQMDEYGICYQTAHQIALHVERAVAELMGIPWKDYDSVFDKLTEHLAAKKLTLVPDRLQMSPYYGYTDKDSIDLVLRMRAATKAITPLKKK